MDYALPDAIRVEKDGPLCIVKLSRPGESESFDTDELRANVARFLKRSSRAG